MAEVAPNIAWRRPIASLNYLLTSHVWRQDHNGFSHQDPGFIDHVVNKKADIVRVYLPPDANTLLSVADHCLRSCDRVNVIVAGKQMEPQWLDIDAAVKHCNAGIGIWQWASNDQGGEPDIVHGLRRRRADVGDARRRRPVARHAAGTEGAGGQRGRPDDAATAASSIRTGWRSRVRCAVSTGVPTMFAYHGYPSLIHRLDLQAAQPRATPRARLSRRRDRRPRHSTWRCSTASTAFIWWPT